MIRNGRPYSIENGFVDDGLITDKPQEVQEEVYAWIRANIVPRKTPNRRHSSYGIKHILQGDSGIYLTNNEFKDAMMQCGFLPEDADELNWAYRISEKSPAFDWKVRTKHKRLR